MKSSSALVSALALLLALIPSCSRSTGTVATINTSAVPSPQKQSTSTEVKSPLPTPTGFVSDYANVFDAESKARLESLMIELKDKSAIEFAVVTVETTEGQPIFDYSLALARAWGIGPKDTSKGGGLLLMLAVKDRQWRIQVSRNLEKDLPDEVCKELGEQSQALYRKGKYGDGIVKNVNLIIQRLEKLKGFKLAPKV